MAGIPGRNRVAAHPREEEQDGERPDSATVPLRYLIAFGSVITISTRKFFIDAGVKGEELQKLEDAWSRAVELHITLWTHPYTKEGLW